jgi:hypothetical protein
MDNFDDIFVNALAEVDILKVEAVGMVIGRTIGVLYKGMTEAGMPEHIARQIIDQAISEMFAFITKSFKPA